MPRFFGSCRHFAFVLSAVFLLFSPPDAARADTPAIQFTGGTTFTNEVALSLGWQFTLSAPVVVTQLGFFDAGNDGLAQNHEVAIWTNTGIQQAQGTVPAGTSSILVDGFRYVSLSTPVLLAPGDYTIAAFLPPTTLDAHLVFAEDITTIASVTYNGGVITRGPSFTMPEANEAEAPGGYFGPNFQIASPVPEPASVLFGLALLGTCGAARRVRRRP